MNECDKTAAPVERARTVLVIEGIDGTGKSAVAAALAERLGKRAWVFDKHCLTSPNPLMASFKNPRTEL